MKTFTLIAAATATTLALAAPASAQVAFAGDGLFGHDYTASQAMSPSPNRSATKRFGSFGYPSNNVSPVSAAQRSVHQIQVRQDRSVSKSNTQAHGVVPVQAPVPNAY